ncbi:hypothetical protein AAFN85_09385 [Mucilaginibacter sp. CAU 1740]|uniref:hypothetical protein n=1 Tax=Mucilaginibacter sp. CAU 1740 TaxID=3140365 RepID=UPI00325B2C1E
MKPKQIIIELTIITAVVITTWLTVKSLNLSNLIDVQLHDTYFVMAPSTLIFPISCLLIMLIYVVKEWFSGYKRRFQNLILLISNFLFIIWLYPAAIFINLMPQPGWTVYPQLSALPNATITDAENQQKNYALMINNLKHFTPIVVIVFMLTLVIISIITGKNWKTNTHEQTSA